MTLDRLGSFALAAAIVLLSALHMMHAPSVWNGVPALLLLFGVFRLVMRREPVAMDEDAARPFAVER